MARFLPNQNELAVSRFGPHREYNDGHGEREHNAVKVGDTFDHRIGLPTSEMKPTIR